MMVGTAPHPAGPPDGAAMLGDDAARVRLAASASTPQTVLRQLADDPQVLVRAAVALNPAATPIVDRLLTTDGDERVRALLARKVAALLPGQSSAEHSQVYRHVRATLLALVEDEAVRVRIAIAEALKSMPEAPRELILRLAHDHALPVSDPVIRLSPLLTDADLLTLLATPPHPLSASSVASRPGLSPAVADAVAAHSDSSAIRALLANRSAAIQEATLDALVGRAGQHVEWHEPLVRRPALSPRSARALSQILAAQWIEVLARRADLDDATAAELHSRVNAGLSPARAAPPSGDAEVLAAVRRLNASGALNEAALLDAARLGDHRRTAAIVAVASGLALPAVDRAASLRNAKGLISLVWKAGFTMRAAAVVQAMLGQLGPGALLMPGPNGAFPLSVDEMEWQIEVLSEPGR